MQYPESITYRCSSTSAQPTSVGIHGNANVDIVAIDDLLIIHVQRGVDHGMMLQRRGHRLHQERQCCQLNASSSVVIFARLPKSLKLGHVRIIKIDDARTVVQDLCICRAMVLRIFDIRSTRTGPCSSWAATPGLLLSEAASDLAVAACALAGAAVVEVATFRTAYWPDERLPKHLHA